MIREKRSIIGLLLVIIVLVVHCPAFPVEASKPSDWGMAELIETSSSSYSVYPQVAIDSSGNAMAVWYQVDDTKWNIYSNQYIKGTGWGSEELVETDTSGLACSPQVAVDPFGNAVAVWYQLDGMRNNIWSNRYSAGTGWGVSELIEFNDGGNALFPQVAVDTTGDAVAVWYYHNGSAQSVYSNRYTKGVGWGTAELIEPDNSGYSSNPQVAVDTSGNAVAVWYQYNGTLFNIWSNRYTKGTGWGSPELIETDDLGNAEYPQVAVDPSGDAVAVWYQSDGIRNNIWSNRYTVGSDWGTAKMIETVNAGSSVNPQVAVDTSGNAVAVWQQSDGTRENIWSNRYTNGTGWGTAELIEAVNSGSAVNPEVGVDSSGNALVVWHQSDGTRENIWSNRYTEGSCWGTAELIETVNSGDAVLPQMAVDPSGDAVVVWHQSDGTNQNIWSNRYVNPDTTPPSLSLEGPSEGLNTDKSLVTVYGTTEPGAVLSINGMLAEVRSDGSFMCNISLSDGANTIVVTAADSWDNSVTVSREVIYYDPLPSLIENMSSVLETLISLETEMNLMRDDINYLLNILSYLKYQLNKTYDDLELVWENLSSLNSKLITTNDDLNSVWDNMNYLKSDLKSTNDDIDSVRDSLASNRIELELIGGSIHSLKDDLNKTNYDVFVVDYNQGYLILDFDTMESDLDTLEDSQDSMNSDLERTKDDLNDLTLLNIVLTGALCIIVIVVLIVLLFKPRRKDDGDNVYSFE